MRAMIGAWMVAVFVAGCAAPVRTSLPGSEPQPSALASQAVRDEVSYGIGAAAATVFYFPGKLILCALGGVAGASILAVTVGSGYGGAAGFVREGCGGKWAVSAEDLKRESSKLFQP